MLRFVSHAVHRGLLSALTLLACGGVSHHDRPSGQNMSAGAGPSAGGEPNGAAGMSASNAGQPNGTAGSPPNGGQPSGGQPTVSDPPLTLCGSNAVRFGTPPSVPAFSMEATLDGQAVQCEGVDGQAPLLRLLLVGAKYLGASLDFSCNENTFHVTAGVALLSDDSCDSYSGAWSSPFATDSDYHSYDGSGTLGSSIVLGADQIGVATGTLHLDLADQADPSRPPRILDGHFTLPAAATGPES
jgi:hypothetical protein